MHRAFAYFNPDDHYETLVTQLVESNTRWLDVGCGRTLFPSNKRLARVLAARCRELVGVDPAKTLAENPYVHRQIAAPIEAIGDAGPFDLVTLRMVAEHLERPDQVLASLARVTRPESLVIIYTVSKWSPVSIVSRVVPFTLHHPLKSLAWRVSQRDTHPVVYRLNTRRDLLRAFEQAGFQERFFAYLDDCRTSGRFPWLRFAELWLRRLLRRVHLRYPETCLLGVYERGRHG
jgi:2-polyprenyl-3-methyl-5-hydroxy-6-metoxy-1,4-benzoquinol methylase